MRRSLFLGVLLLFTWVFAYSQSPAAITGMVLDSLTGEALPFVNIIIKGTNKGCTSDLKGNFKIETDKDTNILIFSYVGYLLKGVRVNNNKDKPIIYLTAAQFDLPEVMVFPKENPAHRIINKVIENKDRNNPEKGKSYLCDIYSKMIFTVDPASVIVDETSVKDSTLLAIKKFTESQHLFISENVTEKRFLYPDHVSEKIIASKISGLRDPLFSVLMNQIQPFTFYNDVISISDKKYINPISKGSTAKYFFQLEDTIYSGADTVFVISFRPGYKRNFDGLKGALYINTNGYAIQNVIAGPAEKKEGGQGIKIVLS